MRHGDAGKLTLIGMSLICLYRFKTWLIVLSKIKQTGGLIRLL